MPSTYKTDFLGLNDWVGTDKPKREDFVADNRAVDGFTKGISNPSLLLNDCFQVWQEGDSFTNPNATYASEQWRCTGTGTVSKNSRGWGMNITGTINVQYEMAPIDFAKYSGKTVTLSWSINGIISAETVTFVANSPIVVNRGFTNCTIDWIKLEIGDRATQYIPRIYEHDFQPCQSYYQLVATEGMFYQAVPESATSVTILLPFTTRMRIAPTIVYKNAVAYIRVRNSIGQALVSQNVTLSSSNTVVTSTPIGFRLVVTVNTMTVQANATEIAVSWAGYVYADARV